jgi:hypothetical protein
LALVIYDRDGTIILTKRFVADVKTSVAFAMRFAAGAYSEFAQEFLNLACSQSTGTNLNRKEGDMNRPNTQSTAVHTLQNLPLGAPLSSVTAESAKVAGRRALRVELTDSVASGAPGVDYIDQPTFVQIPANFENGVVEVDLLSRLNKNAPEYSRAFAGIAYRITGNLDYFEAVYVRPLNGTKADPPSLRAHRAVQYFAFPEWNFERLREEYPDGRYESGADIGPDEWIHLRLEVQDSSLRVIINNVQVLDISDTKGRAGRGHIGLFVDIGTEAFFSNLSITAR